MSFGKFSKSYFGSNYEKARKNFELRERLEFKRKYPCADISKFVFDADLSKTGDLLTTTTKYRNDNGELFYIKGYLFKKNYLDTLHWVPRIWDVGGTVHPFVLAPNTLPYDVKKFTIYVNERVGFWSNFEALSTLWEGRGHHEGSRRQGRFVLCVPVGRVHHLARGRDKQEAPNG